MVPLRIRPGARLSAGATSAAAAAAALAWWCTTLRCAACWQRVRENWRCSLASIVLNSPVAPLLTPSLSAALQSRAGYVRNAALDIFTAASPLGPWEHHPASPAMLEFGPGDGVRMAGRIVEHEGQLYRFGQDCAATYGHRVVAFRIDALTPPEFAQTRVEFESDRPGGGSGAGDSARRQHVDALRLPDGSWLAAVDGGGQRSSPITGPLVRNAVAVGVAWAAAAAVAQGPQPLWWPQFLSLPDKIACLAILRARALGRCSQTHPGSTTRSIKVRVHF